MISESMVGCGRSRAALGSCNFRNSCLFNRQQHHIAPVDPTTRDKLVARCVFSSSSQHPLQCCFLASEVSSMVSNATACFAWQSANPRSRCTPHQCHSNPLRRPIPCKEYELPSIKSYNTALHHSIAPSIPPTFPMPRLCVYTTTAPCRILTPPLQLVGQHRLQNPASAANATMRA
jgi:hypothetical protein